ncbi:MAG: electron transfer flavoprotein subunit beta/FixA family protein [Elusimicrobia bacterium]|nr:electron transfer flavoprotein subunit beta/FixA family protein [Elusimicrobiota bacterium]
MHIVVCVKQVPDSAEIKIDIETGTLIRAGVPSIINPYDHFALQKAIELKKAHKCKLTVISMGPPQAKSVVQLGLALGADDGILLSDRAFAGSDTWATSYIISKAIKKIGKIDIILCGMQAIDGDTAQVGPGIAQHLAMPQVTFCEDIKIDSKKIIVRKLIDDGYEIIEAKSPALFTMIMPKDFEPRYPAFLDIHNSLEKPYHQWSMCDIGAQEQYIGLKGSPTQVDRIYPPPKREKAEMISGGVSEAVEKIVDIFEKENFLKI